MGKEMIDEYADTRIFRKETFQGKEYECAYRPTRRPVDPDQAQSDNGMPMLGHGICGKFNQRVYEANPYIICEQDVPVKMRDGVTIYVDIFRPKDQVNIPAIVSWSFFGKRPSEGLKEWQIMGVAPGTISDMAKFESPDPGFWCRNGYAVANVDPRGVGHSEGDIRCMNEKEGEDGYDFVEWLAGQWWCNGKVGLSGNSNVAMTQWRIAAEQPPHLAAIAPWEGSADMFRELFREGGIPAAGFHCSLFDDLTGPGYIEDMRYMMQTHPFMDAYWESKIPKYDQIKVPCYATACWNHFHLRGAMAGYTKMAGRKKWLRVHRDFEWPDLYDPKNIQDLKLFFDRFLKDINNGWEMTPRIRLEVMDAYDYSYQINRAEDRFPLKRTEYKKLYIDAGKGFMSETPVETESSVSYDGETGVVNFDFQCKEEMELTGYMKVRLWVEADGYDDMDLFVNIQKLSTKGEWIPVNTIGRPHPGAWGRLRVSRRELDPELSTVYQPVLAHKRDLKLSPGEIVPVDIDIVPHSRIWHKGQYIRIQLAGHYIREKWFEPLSWETDNHGSHIVHSGGQYDSYLQIPVIPPRFQDGDCIYR